MGEFIFSVRGDCGETSLLGGTRVPKYDIRCNIFGILDETASALGMAKAFTKKEKVREIIQMVQKDLLRIGSEIATELKNADKLRNPITSEDVGQLGCYISELQREFTLSCVFVCPGKTEAGACIDLARTICRRAERWVAKLKAEGLLRERSQVQRYLNRCADLLFTIARYQDEVE